MRVVILALLPLVLCGGVVLAQTSPTPTTPAAKSPASSTKPASPTKKEARADGVAECMKLWDTATHMSKQEWSRTCERIQSRLENLKVDNLGTMPKAGAKTKRGS